MRLSFISSSSSYSLQSNVWCQSYQTKRGSQKQHLFFMKSNIVSLCQDMEIPYSGSAQVIVTKGICLPALCVKEINTCLETCESLVSVFGIEGASFGATRFTVKAGNS